MLDLLILILSSLLNVSQRNTNKLMLEIETR